MDYQYKSALVRAATTPHEPILFERGSGKVPLGLVHGDVGLYLLSPRAAAAFRDAGLTGWGTFPVELCNGREGVPGYEGLCVSGVTGPVDAERARQIRRVSPGGRAYRARLGLYFDGRAARPL